MSLTFLLFAIFGAAFFGVLGMLKWEAARRKNAELMLDAAVGRNSRLQDEVSLYKDLYTALQNLRSKQQQENVNAEAQIHEGRRAVFDSDWVYDGSGAVPDTAAEPRAEAEAPGNSRE